MNICRENMNKSYDTKQYAFYQGTVELSACENGGS